MHRLSLASRARPSLPRRPRALALALPLAVGLLLAACGSTASSSKASDTTAPGTTVAGTTAGCVTDVDKVIATKPTAASTATALPADLVATLDAAGTSSFAEAASVGAVVAVRTPAGTWIKSYGIADTTTKAPMTDDVHQRIGSVTKTFTGTVLMQLVEQGKVSLSDTIDTYVPGVPNGDRITLEMLADMTSGVASYTASTQFTDAYFAHPETVFTPDQVLAAGIAISPLFEPGAKFNYSNTNTVLLGMVIQKVTGQAISDVFAQNILTPLGLTNTSWPGESPVLPDPHAQGYTLQGSGTPQNPANATNWNPAWGWTAGEMISDVNDLLVYDRALGTGQGLLSSAAQATRLESMPSPGGYGIAMGCIDGWVGHTGELPGFNTSLFYDTRTDTTVVVEANSDIPSGNCSESATLLDDPGVAVCRAPATRMFVALSAAMGHPFVPAPSK
jgi:D-alanyl-D-alanine carboxypeptidase